MKMLDIMLKRRSVRRYKSEDITEESLKQILEAGLLAPTSRNLKPCEFYVVRSRETLEKLSKAKAMGGKMLADCNTAIVVFADSSRADTLESLW